MTKLLILSILSFSIIFILLLIFRLISQRYFNYRLSYKIWYLTIIAGLVPFIPFKFSLLQLSIFSNNKVPEKQNTTDHLNNNVSYNNTLQDLTMSIDKFNWLFIDNILLMLWIIIFIFLSIKFIKSLISLNNFRQSSVDLDINNQKLVNDILVNHQLKQNIVIKKSNHILSPITFWYGNYYILIPASYFQEVSEQRLKYIVLHEFAHTKNKDTLHLIVFNFLSIFMCYNPLILLLKRLMVHDNEVEADIFVLQNIKRKEFKNYAETIMMSILKFNSLNNNDLSHAFNGKKTLLKRRLKNIKKFNFKKQSKIVLVLIYMFSIILIVFQSHYLMGQTLSEEKYNNALKSNNALINKSQYFPNNKGSFVMYSSQKDKYYIYNEKESRIRYSPDSTYKIYLTMFGLDKNIINKNDSYMKWNHTKYPFDEWNKDQTLNSAMKNSVNWYFERISNQIPRNYVARNLSQLNYGNEDLGNYKAYWMENDLKISNLEQVVVLKRLMSQDSNFTNKQKAQLDASLLISQNHSTKLYGKTGTGIVNGKNTNGWFVGYVKTNDDIYYFSTHLSGKEASGQKARSISEELLKEMSVLNDK